MKIGLIGYARTGKSTAARNMPGWHIGSFAGALKRICGQMLKCVDLNVTEDDWRIAEMKERWRPLLVAIGAGMRATDKDYWVKRLIFDLCQRGITDMDDVVVDDMRYASELAWLRKKKGLAIRIYRNGFGPANEEEARSIEEIDRLFPSLPAIANDGLTPTELGLRVIELANEFRLGQMNL